MAEIDYVATAQAHGYRIDGWVEFMHACGNKKLVTRASNYEGLFTMWDPDDDEDGFLLVGNDPIALARNWFEGRAGDDVVPVMCVEADAPAHPTARNLSGVRRRLEL